jgi:hypothetical protein
MQAAGRKVVDADLRRHDGSGVARAPIAAAIVGRRLRPGAACIAIEFRAARYIHFYLRASLLICVPMLA